MATLASGLVGAASGGNFESAATAAAAGYNSAVNNETGGLPNDPENNYYNIKTPNNQGYGLVMSNTQFMGALATSAIIVAAPEVISVCRTSPELCQRVAYELFIKSRSTGVVSTAISGGAFSGGVYAITHQGNSSLSGFAMSVGSGAVLGVFGGRLYAWSGVTKTWVPTSISSAVLKLQTTAIGLPLGQVRDAISNK